MVILILVFCISFFFGANAKNLISMRNHNTSGKTEESTPTKTETGSPTTTATEDHTDTPTTQVDSVSQLIAGMSLEEKIGQMFIVSFTGTTVPTALNALIKDNHVGGVILYPENIENDNQLVTLINSIKVVNSVNKLPLFISTDQEGGRVSRLPARATTFPPNLVIGEKRSATLSYAVGNVMGKELKAYGFNVDFAPVLDIFSNPQNTVIGDRSFGSDPNLVASLGVATMEGIRNTGVIPVIKHFPGHGDTSVDSHKDLPISYKTMDQLEAFELVPFEEAIKDDADMVMVAHIELPNVDRSLAPASLSTYVISDILRQRLHFNGVVITDDMHMEAIRKYYSVADATVKAVEAGTDIVLICHSYEEQIESYNALLQAVQKGVISEARIDQSVRRIILLKEKYNLTDQPSTLAAVLSHVGTEENKEIAKETEEK